ncbi:short chain dehydrogenase/reductase [Aureobasidium subglaciale]|nr:short chain dehydrogenase/reductase [Aureobasidium subglaciale]
MASAVFQANRTALITGGASGVGFALAQLCQKYGMNVALVDKSTEGLEKAKEILSGSARNGQKTEVYDMDVSELPQWRSLKSEIEAKFGLVDLLVLNAGASFKPSQGFGALGTWLDPSYHHKTYDTNVFGVLNGIAAFLPLLQNKNTPSAIVITGSKQGITNPPGGNNPAYNASKATLKHLAEHLAHDLREASPLISTHLLIPGWTYTGFSGNAGPIPDEKAKAKKPEGAWLGSQVAEYGVKKMCEGQFYIVCPDDDVSEELDKARMAYAVGDVVEGRPALSRWHEEYKDSAAEWIQKEAERRKGGE